MLLREELLSRNDFVAIDKSDPLTFHEVVIAVQKQTSSKQEQAAP